MNHNNNTNNLNLSVASVSDEVKKFHKAAAKGDKRACIAFVERGGDPNVRGKKRLTALHIAAHSNQSDTVTELLRLGADLEAEDEDGDTPMILAVINQQSKMVKQLIEAGASMSHRNKKNHTAADVALYKQNLVIVKLLQQYERNLQFVTELHEASMSAAAQEGNCEIVRYWLQNHPDSTAVNHYYGHQRTLAFIAALSGRINLLRLLDEMEADFEIGDSREHTPLFCATQNNHLEAAEFLIREKGCNVNACSITRRTPIFSACARGHDQIVRILIESGADVNHQDEEGTTPIECAVRSGSLTIFNLLVENGARLTVIDVKGYDLAMSAAMSDKLEMIKELKKHNQPLNRINSKNGETALLAASQIDNVEMMRFLLSNGADKNHRNKNGVSPALRAAYNENAAVLRVLGEAGAQLDLPNKLDETAVLCAAQRNSLEMVKYCNAQKCSMQTKDNDGKTLAWYAAKHGNTEMLDFLRKSGAPLDVQDKEGNSPLMVAIKEKAPADVAALLVQAGCNKTKKNKKGVCPLDLAKKQGDHAVLLAMGEAPAGNALPKPVQNPVEQKSMSPSNRLDPTFEKWEYLLDDGKKKTPIGRGGFGKVYKAITDKHQFVAVKVVTVPGANENFLDRVIQSEKRGFEMLKNICHRNIVAFLKCESYDNKFCIFTELIAGIDLCSLMAKQNKPFLEDGVRKFMKQVCFALNYLHRRRPAILHRDIKASNLMLTHEGIVKLIDFGLAKEILNSTVMYTSQHQTGTWYYMAPELFDSDADSVVYTPKSDVWALGCTVYELSTMKPPHSDCRNIIRLQAKIKESMPNLPDEFSSAAQNFYAKCLVFSPDSRADTNDLLAHDFLST